VLRHPFCASVKLFFFLFGIHVTLAVSGVLMGGTFRHGQPMALQVCGLGQPRNSRIKARASCHCSSLSVPYFSSRGINRLNHPPSFIVMQPLTGQTVTPNLPPFIKFLISCLLVRNLDPVEKILHEHFPKRSQTLSNYLSLTLSTFEHQPPPPPHDAACTSSHRLGLNREYL
jgi:hypothetical protein